MFTYLFGLLLALFVSTSVHGYNHNSLVKAKISRSYSTVLHSVVRNDDLAKASREMRRPGASDRIVELRKPMGMELDEDKDGNVFVKAIDDGGRADKSGVVFVGDYVRMVSATFGDDMWSCRNVGLTRVLSCIKVRNTKPVRLVLEASTPEEESKRRAIAYRELTPAEKLVKETEDAELLRAMKDEDKILSKKRKGLFGLW